MAEVRRRSPDRHLGGRDAESNARRVVLVCEERQVAGVAHRLAVLLRHAICQRVGFFGAVRFLCQRRARPVDAKVRGLFLFFVLLGRGGGGGVRPRADFLFGGGRGG